MRYTNLKTVNNLLIISVLLSFIFTTYSDSVRGQVFDNGQNPPGVKWLQINTVNFQIIYPSSLRTEAERMANTLEFIIPKVSVSLGKTPRKISVILQNQGTTSNGFVQLAPRRSEYFTTPSQEFDYQDWLNSLAIHELRHVVQFDKLTGNLKAPFFEELSLAIFGITLPPWFYEGDAVGIETSLTKAGRGRLPSWEMIFRANTLSGLKYSYSKNFLGSVQDLTPGYYQLGYFMTSKLKRDHGPYILDSIMTRISETPYRPYSLSNAIRKYTGITTRALHDSTVSELRYLWQKQYAGEGKISYPAINKRRTDTPTDYLLPVALSKTEILVIKTGKNQPSSFFRLDKLGKEKLILKIGYQELPNFSYAAGKIVWDEFRFDKRYQKRSYNVINIYDLSTKSYTQLTHKSRLFAPALSSDGKIIVAVKVSLENRISLVELDAETGKELKSYLNPLNWMMQTPTFNKAGDRLVFAAVNKDGQSLVELNRQDGKLTQLLPFQSQQISRPVYAGNQIIFRAHYNGLDNIYRYDPVSKKTYQLTSASYGAFNPKFDELTQQVFFNNYQIRGHDVSAFAYNDTAGRDVSLLQNTFINYADILSRQEGAQNVFDSVPRKTFESRPYREINNLFYFHSLSPIADNLNITENPTLGLKLLSNNKLNTLDSYMGYQYDTHINKNEYLAGFTYKRFYPIVDLRYINRGRLAYSRKVIAGKTVFTPVSWREHLTEIQLSIPFVFNRLNQTYNLGVRSSTSYTSRYHVTNRPDKFNSSLSFPMKYQVYINRNTRRSPRDLAPDWGQNITISYQHFPFESNLQGDLFTIRSLFYTPGLLTNHSFQTSFNYQLNSGSYNLTNDIPLVSGYYNLTPTKEISNTLLLDYRFPLFYPDWEIGPLAYIKRFKGGFFADFENISTDRSNSLRTFGAELRADMNILRFYLPNFELSGKIIFVNQNPAHNPIFETGFSYNF